ncbi:MAG: acyl-CoA desaturase [Planctomycetota bacterium]|nr:acyl-CoA desaturase [Planctomycetota bacterium]MDA1248504.1 acyl-CoA desaturase [Planctomycetota bacterium]
MTFDLPPQEESSTATIPETSNSFAEFSLPAKSPIDKSDTDGEPKTGEKKKRKVIRHAAATPLTSRFPNGINWWNFGWMAAIHAGAIASLWHFSLAGLAVCVVLHFVTACLGVTLGYHRLLTHGSLTVPAPVKYFFTMCGMLSTEGSPLFWVASHRKHHVLSDQEGDPHTPNDGFWWSHILWFKPKKTREEEEELLARWAPDLWKDPVQRLFNNIFPVFSISLAIALFLIGEWTMESGWSLMLWGFCMRTVLCYHSTWFVNSATHVWGYRNYETTDRSRNLWWVALASYGEGWHNNHHAHQRLAAHGHRWWEFDVTYMVIRVLKFLRLATNVHDTIPEQETKTA